MLTNENTQPCLRLLVPHTERELAAEERRILTLRDKAYQNLDERNEGSYQRSMQTYLRILRMYYSDECDKYAIINLLEETIETREEKLKTLEKALRQERFRVKQKKVNPLASRENSFTDAPAELSKPTRAASHTLFSRPQRATSFVKPARAFSHAKNLMPGSNAPVSAEIESLVDAFNSCEKEKQRLTLRLKGLRRLAEK